MDNYDKKRKFIYIAYIIVTVLIALIPVTISFTHKGTSVGMLGDDFLDISNDWRLEPDENSEALVNGTYGEKMDAEEGVLNIYYKIPENHRDAYLIYRSKDVYTKVYVDDELLYETQVYESKLYNESPGNIWNSAKINNEYAGKWIRLEISMVYDTKSVVVDLIKIGDKSDILMDYIQSKTYAIVLSIFIIIVGVSLLILNIYSFVSKKVPKAGNIALSVYAITIGIWCLCETNVLQLIIDDVRLIQLLDNIVMFTGTLPMLFFIDANYDILKNRIVRIFSYIDIGILAYCFVMQVTGISDFHHSIMMAWIAFFVFGTLLFVTTTASIIKKMKAHEMKTSNILHVVGFMLMTVSGLIEGIRYIGTDGSDRAQMLRLGILLFIMCFAIGNQLENYKMIEQGAKYDIVKNLAYKDGLTGLGNRTSYLEKISELTKKDVPKVGIVFLDINNLKTVNDTYGHDMGDKYIVAASEMIEESFGKYGESYRIGGDEFCVFIEGIDISNAYKEAKDKFDMLVIKSNKMKKYKEDIEVACGFSLYDKNMEKSIADMIQEADELMYKNKAELKIKRNKKFKAG